MKFWDASAIVPLIIEEASTTALRTIVTEDPAMLVWWATEVECASVIARLEREGALDGPTAATAIEHLRQFAGGWNEIDPSDTVREAAVRFLRVHPLQTADALQLAAAFVAADRRPSSLEIVTLDERLATAAHKEGFRLVSPRQ